MITAEQLFEQNKDIVYRYVYSVLWNKEDTEDITSQTFVTALRKIDQAQSHAKHSTWLIAIARNHISNLWQKKQLSILPDNPGEDEHHWEDITPDTNAQTPLEQLITEEDTQRVHHAMAQLSPIDRELITLKLWQGLTHQEVSRIIHLAEPTVKVYYRRALHRLYELLKPKDKKQWAVYFLALDHIKQHSEFKLTQVHMLQSTSSRIIVAISITAVIGIVIGLATGYLLFSKPADQLVVTPTPSPSVSVSPTVFSTITASPSTTASPTPTTPSSISSNWETKSSTIDNRSTAGWQLQFTMKLPKGAKIVKTTTPFPAVRITTGGTSLLIDLPYESYPYKVTKKLELAKHDQFGTWYRLNGPTKSTMNTYSNLLSLNQTCEGPTPVGAPCGSAAMRLEQSVYFRAVCEKTDDSYATCDEIMKLLKVKKI